MRTGSRSGCEAGSGVLRKTPQQRDLPTADVGQRDDDPVGTLQGRLDIFLDSPFSISSSSVNGKEFNRLPKICPLPVEPYKAPPHPGRRMLKTTPAARTDGTADR
jgi:hypothetical protein